MRTLSCQRCFEVFIDWSQREKLFYFLLAPHGQFFFIGCMPSGINFLHRHEEGEQEREWRQGIAGHSVRNTQFFKWKTEEGCRSECHGIDLQKGCRYLAHSRVALPLRRKMLWIHELAESHKQSWPNERMGISTQPHSPEYFHSIIYYPKTGLPRFFPEIFVTFAPQNNKEGNDNGKWRERPVPLLRFRWRTALRRRDVHLHALWGDTE